MVTATETEEVVETQAQSPAETQDEETTLTEDQNSGVTDGADEGTDDKGSDEGEDSVAKAIAAAVAAREEELREQIRAEAEQERKQQTRTETIEEVKQAFPSAVTAVRAIGSEAEVDDAVMNRIINAFEKYNLGAWQGAERLVHQTILDKLYGMVPKDQHDAFTATNNEKDLDEWVADAAERTWMKTKGFKGIETVDQLLEHASPKLKADIAARDAKNEEKGKVKILKAPDTEPSLRNNSSSVPAYTSAELDAMPVAQYMALGNKEQRDAIRDAARMREARR